METGTHARRAWIRLRVGSWRRRPRENVSCNHEFLGEFPRLDALKSGDEMAWARAARLLWPIAIRPALKPPIELGYPEAEDSASEAMRRIVGQINSVNSIEHLQALTAIIGRNCAIDLLRAKTALKRGSGAISWEQLTEDGNAEFAANAASSDQGRDLERAELALLLKQAMSSLSPEERGLLLGHMVDHLSYQQLSDRYGLPLNTVASRISRALPKILREIRKSPRLMQELRAFLR